MKRRLPWLIAFMTLVFPACGFAQPASQVRIDVKPAGPAWVGQRVEIVVTLLTPGTFAEAASFDLPSVKDLVLLSPSGHAVVGTETVNGTDFTTQQHEISAFAQRAGKFEIPAFKIRFATKATYLATQTQAVEVATTPVSFEVKLPPGAENLGTLISAKTLTVDEKWSPKTPNTAKTGDAFTRTITFRAEDVPGMAFPPFAAAPVPGLAVYAKPPEVHDNTERGELTGVRVETINYVCQEPGHVTIPAVHFSWWDIGAEKLQTIDLPEQSFDIALDPATARRLAKAHWRERMEHALPWLGAGLVIAVAAWLAVRLGAGRQLHRAIQAFQPVHLTPLNPTGESLSERTRRSEHSRAASS
ncbi:MAG: BatD family protein [Nibricoccus sp.]